MIFGEDEYNIVAMAKNKKNNIESGVVVYDCDDGEFIAISLPKNATIKDNIAQSHHNFIEVYTVNDSNYEFRTEELANDLYDNKENIEYQLKDVFYNYLIDDIKVLLSIYDIIYQQYSNIDYQQWIYQDRDYLQMNIIDNAVENYMYYGGVISDIPTDIWLEDVLVDLNYQVNFLLRNMVELDIHHKEYFTDMKIAIETYNIQECKQILNKWEGD